MRYLGLAFVGACFAAATSACGPADSDSDTGAEAPEGPEIVFVAPTEALVAGEPFTVGVTAADAQGVARVVTYFRTQGQRTWSTADPMVESEGTWTVALAGEVIQAPGLELYFKGEDALGAVSFQPINGTREPLALAVRGIGLPLPYAQSFDDVPNGFLREIGWANAELGFQGYDFAVTTSRSNTGESSVFHGRAPAEISGEIDDWLISPPLDLTTTDKAQVSWYQYVDRPDDSTHELWISTSSADPSSGAFVKVMDLAAPPSGFWNKAEVVDLSAWAGNPAVYLAWVYKGKDQAAWWIDDVAVGPLLPDLRVSEVRVAPSPIDPGDSGVVTLTLINTTPVEAIGVTVEVEPEAGATFGGPVSVGAVPADGEVAVDVPVTIDPDFFENGWIDLVVTARSGDQTWESPGRLLVGERVTMQLSYRVDPIDDLDSAQLVRIFAGAGDPDAPAVELPVVNQLQPSGTYSVELDITDYAEYLPPEPGNRWWTRVETGPTGEISRFVVEYGGVDIPTTDLGGFFGFSRSLFFLPEPPDPQVTRQTSAPSPIAPGSTVSWTVDLANVGASTSGPTTVSLVSADPSMTVTAGGPASVGSPTGWGRGVTVRPSFSFTVAADKKDSVPLRAVLRVQDSFETLDLPVEIAVPWPVLQVTAVVIDDWSDGDGDGLLEAGEKANLQFDVTNVGGLGSFGSVTCTLARTGGAADAAVLVSSGFFGILSAARTESEDAYEVELKSGATSDDVDLELRCTDRTETYVMPVEILVGERPWLAISPLRDPVGDVRDAYRFDFVDGLYRVDGDTLEMILRSSTAHGGLTGLFIEAWGSSSGGTYSFYNIVASGSTGSVRGYRGSFSRLGTVSVTEVDANRVKMSLDLVPLGLRVNTMNIGFGAGFCGGTEQYCDHFPDGWGAPYTGLNTSRWVTMKW
jgi:hypothetical protein